MRVSELKAPLIVISTIVCLALLLGGSVLYERGRAEAPIRERLSEHPGVAEFTLERGDEWVITVSFVDHHDLRRSYRDISVSIGEVLGRTPHRLKIEDAPDVQLLDLWDRVEILLHDGAASGRLTEMRDRLYAELDGEDARVNLQVDDTNIYLSMIRDDGAHLHRVVVRAEYFRGREAAGE